MFYFILEGIFVCQNKVGRFYEEIGWVWGGTMGFGGDLESVSNLFGGMNYWIEEYKLILIPK